MCGASLTDEERPEASEEKKRGLPNWVGSLAALLLAVAILGAGGFGLYSMLASEPDPEPTAPAVTASPTGTPPPTNTPTPPPSPTPTPTPLPPRAHDVEEGETLSDIAELYGVSMDEILALNPEVDPELINAGQVLLVPADAAAGQEGADAKEGEFLVHVVNTGETLSSIAEEYGVSVALIRTANDLAPDDETIRAEQSLVIPISTPTPTPSPTPVADWTPTPRSPYAAPPLLQPPDDAVLEGETPVLLQWAAVSLLAENEWYELRLWQPGGGVVSTTVRTRATAWRVPAELLAKAETDAPRMRWRVRVVRELSGPVFEAAGDVSPTRSFVWQRPEATEGAPSSPTP
jgi:LysM repeat protein